MTAAPYDAVHPVDSAEILRLLPNRPRLLALGEPTHGEDALLEVRNDLFRQLVEREGYRTIAIESDCMRGLAVDDYVTTGAGSLDEVMAHGFSHEFGTSAANRELVRWMRAFNDGRPAADRVRFAGFDGPLEFSGAASPRQAMATLHAYLAARVDRGLLPCTAEALDHLLGDDEHWTEPAAMMDPSRSAGNTAGVRELMLLAVDLAAVVDMLAPQLIVESEGRWRARLYGRTAIGLLRYHFAMADTAPSRMARLLAVRASMMAENLRALTDRGPVLAFAHNGHLQRDKSSIRMGGAPVEWWSAGAIAEVWLGEQYAHVATALGTIAHHGVQAPPPDTVEGLLYALPEDRCVVDPRKLSASFDGAPPAPRESPWFGYAPLDPARLDRVDALVFVKDTHGRS